MKPINRFSLIIFAVTAIFLLTAGCCSYSCGQIIDQNVIHNQTVKGKFQGQSQAGMNYYHDCVIVLSDYQQYRLWMPTGKEITDTCNAIPENERIELTLTKFTDSEGRYDITSWQPEPCEVTIYGNSTSFKIPDDCAGDVNVIWHTS